MGDRYYLTPKCPHCGYVEMEDYYYAPTSGFMFHACAMCKKEIDLFDSIEANSGQGLRLIVGNKPNEGADIYSGVFETEANDVYLDKEHPEKTIRLKYLTRIGFQIEKVFTFYNENYHFYMFS